MINAKIVLTFYFLIFVNSNPYMIYDEYKNLNLEVAYENDDSFQILITRPKENKYRVPNYVIKDPIISLESPFSQGFSIEDKTQPLNFKIIGRNSTTAVFSFTSLNFNYSEFYISFTYILTSNLIFGNGERVHEFQLNPGMYTVWPNDTNTPYDKSTGGYNLYGIHSFILNACSDGSWLGVFFVNSNAQDLIINTPQKDKTVHVEQRTIGGIIDLRIIRGDTPNDVIKKYQTKIGKPLLPPIWALGWHQCRWGYKNDKILEEVVKNYQESLIPLDAIWSDIDYMRKYNDFTVDKEKYPNLKEKIDTFHKKGVHYVPIIDLGIAEPSQFSKKAKEMNALIISNFTKKPYINNVWPGNSVFPDFTHPNGTDFWKWGLDLLKNLVDYDGIWLDMNEPAVFNDELYANIHDLKKNLYSNLPYIPGNGKINLVTHTMSVNALVYGDQNPEHSTIFNMKAVNTYLQNKATYDFLQRDNKRAFILSRSSLFGQGSISNHWLGDNESTYSSMRLSIPGIFNFQMFGFNLVGSDICGFNGNTTDQLCARWTNLGAFYPFSRNHNTVFAVSQEPYTLGDLTLNAARKAIGLRYSLIRYMYTQMFVVSREGGTTFKPIFFEFPNDLEAFKNIDRQFFLGNSLLFSPNLEESEDDYQVYLPNSNWNKFPSGENAFDYIPDKKEGTYLTVDGSFEAINIHIRGGSIIPFQNIGIPLNTKELTETPTNLVINPDHNGNAKGKIVFDDGITADVFESKKYLEVDLDYSEGILRVYIANSFNYDSFNSFVEEITLMRTQIAVLDDPKIYFLNGDSRILEYKVIDKNLIKFRLPYIAKIYAISHIEFNSLNKFVS